MRRALVALVTLGLVLLTSVLIGADAQTATSAAIPDIERYRSWTRMNGILLNDPSNPRAGPKNTFVNLTSDQLKAIYAQGGRVRIPFPEGTVLVRETLAPGTDIVAVLFVQRKDSSATRTRGWVFSGFSRRAADQPLEPLAIPDPVTRCLDCHAQVSSTDFVFTPYLNRPDPPAARSPSGERVDIFNNQFGPSDLRVKTGAMVVWANYDIVPHDVKAANLLFESGNLPLQGRYVYRFEQAGTYDYFCAVHLEMRGRVVVER
ncbi:MAG: cytochrome P460 family protein [Alphaproteobacteria bacterium]